MELQQNEGIFFFWHCRNGQIPESVIVYGSWDDCSKGTQLQSNGGMMFGGSVKIPSNAGTFYYYFEVDGERHTDYTKLTITIQSEEHNVLQLPLKNTEKGLYTKFLSLYTLRAIFVIFLT